MGLTHTDLKPENILLKLDSKKQIIDMSLHPIHVQRKKEMYDGERVDDEDESSCFSDNEAGDQKLNQLIKQDHSDQRDQINLRH